ncbi:MAG: hypothetical protein ACI4RH_03400 [Huintestinicola sp.]
MAKKAKAINMERMVQLVRSIKEHEQIIKQLTAEADEAKDEIKAAMTEFGLEEMLADVFTVRYKKVESERFDTKAFKAGNPDTYKMYLTASSSMKFTIS